MSTDSDKTEREYSQQIAELPDYELTPWLKKSDRDRLTPCDGYRDPVQMVRRAFADVAEEYDGSPDDRALTAHTGWLDAGVAGQALQEIGRYNAFHAEVVAEGLEDMPEDAFFSVGREGSPVVYITTRHPEDAKQVLRGLERDRPAIDDELQKYVRGGVQLQKVSVAPDELSSAASTTYPRMTDDGGERHVIRAWWD